MYFNKIKYANPASSSMSLPAQLQSIFVLDETCVVVSKMVEWAFPTDSDFDQIRAKRSVRSGSLSFHGDGSFRLSGDFLPGASKLGACCWQCPELKRWENARFCDRPSTEQCNDVQEQISGIDFWLE